MLRFELPRGAKAAVWVAAAGLVVAGCSTSSNKAAPTPKASLSASASASPRCATSVPIRGHRLELVTAAETMADMSREPNGLGWANLSRDIEADGPLQPNEKLAFMIGYAVVQSRGESPAQAQARADSAAKNELAALEAEESTIREYNPSLPPFDTTVSYTYQFDGGATPRSIAYVGTPQQLRAQQPSICIPLQGSHT